MWDKLKGVVATIVAYLLGEPFLIYRAGFRDETLEPLEDPLGLGRLHPTNNMPGKDPRGAITLFPPPSYLSGQSGAAQFTCIRPTAWPQQLAVTGAVVFPFPSDLDVFRIQALFSEPKGAHGNDDTWAVVILARGGDVPDPSNGSTSIAVSLQSADQNRQDPTPMPGVRMNTPGGLPVGGTPGPNAGLGLFLPQSVFDVLFAFEAPEFDPGTYLPFFELEAQVDRVAQVALASLRVRSYTEPT
jgi:hypothetical protein